MAKLRNVPVYPATLFSWLNGNASVEASDLAGAGHGFLSFLSQIYDDACDVGFYVRGRGKTLLFTLEKTVREYDDDPQEVSDIVMWVFVNDKIKISVFNDQEEQMNIYAMPNSPRIALQIGTAIIPFVPVVSPVQAPTNIFGKQEE